MPPIVAERPANSGLLQFGVPSLCSRFPGMRAEFGESLRLAPRIFPFLGDAGRRPKLRADAHRIRSAPYPSAHAKAQMRQQIEQIAERGAPSVSRLVELDGPLDFQTQRLTSEIHGERRQLGFAETADAVALICWLHRDAMIAKLDAEISTEADDGAALSHEARQKAEAEVMGDLLDIERQEAALVFAAWEHGLACEHRSDCSQLAILQVQLVTVPRAAPPPSSPERAGYNLIGGR
jgi:hypothetical protein